MAGEVHVVLLFTDSDGRARIADSDSHAPLASPHDPDADRSRAGTAPAARRGHRPPPAAAEAPPRAAVWPPPPAEDAAAGSSRSAVRVDDRERQSGYGRSTPLASAPIPWFPPKRI